MIAGSAEGALWDDLIIAALQVPMVAEADVKDWLKGKEKAKTLEVLGLAPGKRVPERKNSHRVRRLT